MLDLRGCVIFVFVFIILTGCSRRIETDRTAKDVFERLGPGLGSIPVAGPPPFNINKNLDKDDAVNWDKQITYVPFDKYKPKDSMYPYVLFHGTFMDGVASWEVRNDASGIYFDAGRLRIKQIEGALLIYAPNKTVQEYITRVINGL